MFPNDPNPEDDVKLPNGIEDPELVPNAGAAVELDDGNPEVMLVGPPNNDPAAVPPNSDPVVVGAVDDEDPLPKPPNFGGSTFCSPPNVNFGAASDENIPRFAGTPSVVVVPTSPEN